MNIDPEMPDSPKRIPPAKPSERSFEKLLEELKPKLDKLPAEQRLLPVPPTAEMLEEVQEYVKSLGLSVPPMPPPKIGIGGEFLDPLQLKEGRVGLLRNVRVLAFLHRYSDKSLRTIVIHVRDGVDARKIGLAIIWGQIADLPDNIAQTQILPVTDFFAICACDLSRLVDVSALERFKLDYQKQQEAEMSGIRQNRIAIELRTASLETERQELKKQFDKKHSEMVRESNRAEFWKVVAFAALVLAVVALVKALI